MNTIKLLAGLAFCGLAAYSFYQSGIVWQDAKSSIHQIMAVALDIKALLWLLMGVISLVSMDKSGEAGETRGAGETRYVQPGSAADKAAKATADTNPSGKRLFDAAFEGQTERALALIKNGADINGKDDYGWTPLHLAASKGQSKTVNALINAGARLDMRDVDGKTPLDIATERNGKDSTIVRLLREAMEKQGD